MFTQNILQREEAAGDLLQTTSAGLAENTDTGKDDSQG